MPDTLRIEKHREVPMKRFAAIFIAAAMLLTFAACSEKEVELSQHEAYNKYVKAVESMNAAGSFSGEVVMRTIMTIMGEPFEYATTTGLKQVLGSGDNFQAEIDATLGDANYKTYYRDGTFYYESAGEKVKFAMPGEEYLNMTNSQVITQILFPEESIFGLEATGSASGSEIRFEVVSAGMEEILYQLAGYSVTGGVQEHGTDELDYTFEDVVITMQLDKNGAIQHIRLAFLLVLIHMGEPMDAYIEFGITVSQIGGVTVDFPDDIDTYTDLGAEQAHG